jgi:type II secretory pathway component GspD/PulD (secretin)
MKRHAINRLILSAIAVLLLNGVLLAGVDEIKNKIDNERISLDLKNKPLTKVLQVYATLLGVEVHIQSCEKQRPVTITFDNITMRTSLNAICESAGLQWNLEQTNPPVLNIECQNQSKAISEQILRPAKSVIPQDPVGDYIAGLNPRQESAERLRLVQVSLKKADLHTVLSVVAKLLHAHLAMDAGLQGETVTLTRGSVTISQFMDAVCDQVHAKWKLSENNPSLLTVVKSR